MTKPIRNPDGTTRYDFAIAPPKGRESKEQWDARMSAGKALVAAEAEDWAKIQEALPLPAED